MLKPCPFCGGRDCLQSSEDGFPIVPACLYKTKSIEEIEILWNTRPIEDMLIEAAEAFTNQFSEGIFDMMANEPMGNTNARVFKGWWEMLIKVIALAKVKGE